MIEVSASQGRARLISIRIAISCFVNNLHPAHAFAVFFLKTSDSGIVSHRVFLGHRKLASPAAVVPHFSFFG